MSNKPTYEELEKRIQELEQADQERKHALSLLQRAEEIGLSGSWSQNLHTGVEEWSVGEYRIHGLSEDITPSYELHLQCLHPEDRERHARLFQEHLTSDGTRFSQVYRIKTQDGTIRHIRADYQFKRDDNGRAVTAYGTDKDITENMKKEEAIKVNISRFQSIYDSSLIGIAYWKSTGELFDANDTWLKTIGYSREDMENGIADWSKITPPEHLHLDEKGIEQINAKGFCDPFEKEYIRKDGTRVPILIGAAALDDIEGGGVTYMVDMSLIRETQEALEESKTKYLTLLESLQEGVWTIGKDAKTSFVNQRMAEMLGYTKDEMLGKHLFDFMDVKSIEDAKLKLDRRRNGIKEQHDFKFIKKDGQPIYATIETAPLRDENGSYSGAVAGVINITKRKQTEEALKQSEKKYRTLVNNIPDYVMRYDQQYRHIFANEKAISDTGRTVETYIGKTHREMGFPDHLCTLWENAIDRVYETGEMQTETFEWNSDLGTKVLKWSVLPEFSEDGSILTILGISHDITDIKNANETIRKSQALLDSTERVSKIGGWEWDVEAQTMFWTDETYKIHGFDPDKISPRSTEHIEKSLECFDADDRPVILKAFKDCADKGEEYDLDFPFTKATGERIWIRTVAKPVYKGGHVVKVIGNIMDITDRKQAIYALEKSEARYRKMMESISDPLYVGSPEQTIEYMNPAMIERLGRDATGEVCYKAIHGLEKNCEGCPFDRVRNGETIEENVLSPLDDRNYRVTHMPVLNDNLTVSKLTIYRDIHDYLTALSDKEKVQAQLQQAQKIESIGNLAGGIAHDFNNILASIIGFTELALDEVEKGTTQEDNLQEVCMAGKRAKDLVNQILAFARQANEKVKPVRISKIIRESLKLLRASMPTTVDIKQELNSESLTLGNATLIEQAIINLATNAMHSMEESGGVLTVRLSDVYIDEETAKKKHLIKSGNYMQVAISDTGVGIPPEVIESIFEPYFTTKEAGKGTGMGLALVHGTVKKYGGTIMVDSQPGYGTTFTILLPTTKKQEKSIPYRQSELPQGTERILFVDDELPVAKMSKRHLETLGYEVIIRTSSVEALELFKTKPNDFDLVVTDMTMPNLTGDKLAVELIKYRRDIPVVLCTGYSKRISDENASEIGIKAFAYKPVVKADLAKTVRKVLDEAKS